MRGATNAAAAAGGGEMYDLFIITDTTEYTLPKSCRCLIVDGYINMRPSARGASVLLPEMSCEVGTASVALSADGRTIEITDSGYTINAIAFW